MDIEYLIRILKSASRFIKTSSLDDDPIFVPNFARIKSKLIEYQVFNKPSINVHLDRLKDELKLGICVFAEAIEAFKNSETPENKGDVTILRVYLNTIIDYIDMSAMFPVTQAPANTSDNFKISFQEILADLSNYFENLINKILRLEKLPETITNIDSMNLHPIFAQILIKLKSYLENEPEFFQLYFISAINEIIHHLNLIEFFFSENNYASLKIQLFLLNKYLDCLGIKVMVSATYSLWDFSKILTEEPDKIVNTLSTQSTPPVTYLGSASSTLQIGDYSISSPHEVHRRYSSSYCLNCYPNFVRSRANSDCKAGTQQTNPRP